MKRLSKICALAGLGFYLAGLYLFWRLCQYGVRAWHLRYWLAGCGAAFLLCLAGGLAIRRWAGQEQAGPVRRGPAFWCCLALAIAATVWSGSRIVYAAIPYHGALSWQIDKWMNHKNILLEHDDLLADGPEGFLTDLDRRMGLPSELYTTNALRITFDGDGSIRTIYASLYGPDRRGTARMSYLIGYDRAGSEKMDVWRDRYMGYGASYDEDERLGPLTVLWHSGAVAEQLARWRDEDGEADGAVYTLSYAGAQQFATVEGLVLLPGDADGDGVQSGVDDLSVLRGGHVTGFTLTLSRQNGGQSQSVSYIMEPDYTSPQQIMDAEQARQIEEAKAADGWITGRTNEDMYFFLNDQAGWRLVVTDAALGSRFYVLERTEDGGDSWERINADPFGGRIGLAEGLVFFDGSFGFAGLAGASQSYSTLYVTRDGGLTFDAVDLPLDTVTALPPLGQELGYTAEDYDYCEMPERTGETLLVTVVPDKGEREGLVFRSEDRGMTWRVTD